MKLETIGEQAYYVAYIHPSRIRRNKRNRLMIDVSAVGSINPYWVRLQVKPTSDSHSNHSMQ